MIKHMLIFCIFAGVFAVRPGADTFFVYLETAAPQPMSQPAPDGVVSGLPVKEGLFDGLFDLKHVVFDNVRPEYTVGWKSAEFEELFETAAGGGAHFMVAAKVSLLSSPYNETVSRLQSSVQYYCYEVKREVLVGSGILTRDNRGSEEELDGEQLGLLLGQDLSLEIDRICSLYKSSGGAEGIRRNQ
jgi:hypothetical protein